MVKKTAAGEVRNRGVAIRRLVRRPSEAVDCGRPWKAGLLAPRSRYAIAGVSSPSASLLKASVSICRTRSRVSPRLSPISLSVLGS